MSLKGYTNLQLIYKSNRTSVYKAQRETDKSLVKIKVGNKIRERELYNEYTMCLQLSEQFGPVVLELERVFENVLLVFKNEGMRSLDKHLPEGGFELRSFLQIAIGVVKALEHIHKKNIIHKDINPSNILVSTSYDTVKLIDFEFASQVRNEVVGVKTIEVLDGTLPYIAPEQTGRINRIVDYRADFYSLGATFYQMLTGHLPFANIDALELVHCHIASEPRPVTAYKPSIPEMISAIITKLLEKQAENRYQSATGILMDLERCFRQLETEGKLSVFELGRYDFCNRLQIPQKLYGREKEIEQLLGTFQLLEEKQSVITFISGYSGVGKTALVHEVYKPMTERNGLFASGKFGQLQKDTPYSALIQAFEKLCRYIEQENSEVFEKWKSVLKKALSVNGRIITDIIPSFENIIGPQPELPKVGAIEAQKRFELTFKRFVKALCSEEHPLILFLDDLQWGDLASVNLLKSIVSDQSIRYLYVILSYRDNEVGDSHPLHSLISEAAHSEAFSNHAIHLSNLSEQDVSKLLAESLSRNEDELHELSRLIMQKTAGNAFFTHQFIQNLVNEKLLSFDNEIQKWIWDINKIEQKNITSNVVELMAAAIKKLPQETAVLLNYAACIGDQFSLDLLSTLYGKSKEETFAQLKPAVFENLVVPLSKNYKFIGSNAAVKFRFLHDRVQQAAYALASENDREKTHLQIARNLQHNTSEETQAASVLEIADQYAHCLNLISQPEERYRTARLFLRAGKKAKKNTAYNSALSYLKTAQQCLDEESAETEHALTIDIVNESAEAAFLCGEYEAMDEYIAFCVDHARSAEEEAPARMTQILAKIAQSKRGEAVSLAVAFLAKLGIELSEFPAQEEIGAAMVELNGMLEGRTIESLVDLPPMTDTVSIVAMQIMAATISAAFVASPALMVLLTIKQVQLSIEKGNIAESCFAYVFYGVVLCGVVMDIENGYRFGLMAARLLDSIEDKKMKAKTIHSFNDLVRPWKENLAASLRPLAENYETAIELGDTEFAAYSAHIYSCYVFFNGENLQFVESQLKKYTNAIKALNQTNSYSWNCMFWQLAKNLYENAVSPTLLNGSVCNEAKLLQELNDAKDKMGLAYFYVCKTMLCHLFYEYEEALGYSHLTEPNLDGATGKYTVSIHFFYDSLVRTALLQTAPDADRKQHLEKIQQNQAKLQLWAKHAPENFQHKYDLIEAELLAASGDFSCIQVYEKAIKGAKHAKFIHEEALAYELAAQFYLKQNIERLARTYFDEAFQLYEIWGARSKCTQLQKQYPEFFLAESFVHTSSSGITSSILDQQSIIKASQSISKELKYEELLSKLLSITVENAGANKGVLIIEENQEYFIQAQKTLNPPQNTVLQNIPIHTSQEIPLPLIQRVMNTHERILIGDASLDENYNKTEYVRKNSVRSILCYPIQRKKRLIGILYLENNFFSNVFSKERMAVIDVLISQAAISIDNAKLFHSLSKQRNFSSSLINNSPSLICGISSEGITTFVNPRVETVTGYSGSELVGQNWWECFFPDHEYEQVRKLFSELAFGEVADYEMSLKCKNGTQRIISWNSYTHRDGENRITEFFGFGNDITEARKTREALAKSQEQLNLAMAGANDGIWDWNLQTNSVQFDDRYYMMAGYEPNEFGASFGEWIKHIHPEDVELCKSSVTKYIEGKSEKYDVNFRFLTKTEQWMWIRARGKIAQWLPDGSPLRFIGTHTDITAQKEAEKAVAESEAKLRKLFEKSTDAIFVINRKSGGFENANRAAETLTGRSIAGLKQYKVKDIINVDFDFQSAQTNGNANSIEFGEILFFQPDGSKRIALFSLIPVSDSLVFGLARDISERKEAEDEIRQKNLQLFSSLDEIKKINQQLELAKEKAEESSRLKTTFLANLSHEIRTPMNGILGFANLLEDEGLTDIQQKMFLQNIQKSGQRMLNLINDLVDISKIESNQIEAYKTEINIGRLTDSVCSLFQLKAQTGAVRFLFTPDNAVRRLTILSDETKLEQILTNLLNNAFKFTKYGQIEFGYKRLDNDVLFYIKDTGPGIPENMHELVFERFRQVEDTPLREEEGAGLGLAIAKSFVEVLGGRIWLESELGKGSSFYFTVPVTSAVIEGSVDMDANEEQEIPHDRNILIAEDDEMSYLYLKELLAQFDVHIYHGKNGKEVVQLFNSGVKFDLILMDIKMPVMNGWDTIKEIQKTDPNVPIIAQTAYASSLDKDKAIDAGCADYLSKPIGKDALRSIVSKYLKHS